MKKLFYIFCLLISVLCLCGCDNARDKIFSTLKRDKIITESMKEIDTEHYFIWSGEWCRKQTYYIYEDSKGDMIAIRYEKTEDTAYESLITIYYNVTTNNNVNILDSDDVKCTEEGHYQYENGDYTDESRYNFGTKKVYEAYVKNGLFGKQYTLKEHK